MKDDTSERADSPHILAVDDDKLLHGVLERLFKREGLRITTCAGAAEAIETLKEDSFDLVLTDFMMPKMDGLELLAHIRENYPHVNVIMITAHSNVQHAVQSMRNGAVDYIPKPFSTTELVERVKKGLKIDNSQSAQHDDQEEAPSSASAERSGQANGQSSRRKKDHPASSKTTFIGEHESIQRLKNMIPRVAQSRAPVFIHGESGTGKEILSRRIHERSKRGDKPYITINCANLPRELVESHLFGHQKGAFTGAVDDMIGAFERADAGTLLLDEVTEVELPVQAKLLRVLQEQEFQKVGASSKQTVDVRVIATSNRDLEKAVSNGDFREDLYHRLAVFPLRVPPLRGRLSDIPLLAEHFVDKYTRLYDFPEKTIAPSLLQHFQSYRWPGNVRELENMIHRGVVLAADEDCITPNDVINDFFSDEGQETPDGESSGRPEKGSPPQTISDMERQMILRTLAEEGTNQKRAAEKLGISARTIRNKLQKYREEGFAV